MYIQTLILTQILHSERQSQKAFAFLLIFPQRKRAVLKTQTQKETKKKKESSKQTQNKQIN